MTDNQDLSDKLKVIAARKRANNWGYAEGELETLDEAIAALSRPVSSDSREAGASDKWLLRVRPSFQAGRAKYERAGHCGYTNDVLDAGRFTEAEAKEYEADCPDKLEAIPDPYGASQPVQSVDAADEARFEKLLHTLRMAEYKGGAAGNVLSADDEADALRSFFKASRSAQAAQDENLVDDLAQYIREIDGNNSRGAAFLAEEILGWLARRSKHQ